MFLSFVISLSIFSTSTFGSQILGIVPTPSYSHQVAFRPIWKALASRGHHLTLLTTDPINDAALVNLTEIDLSVSYKKVMKANLNDMSNSNFLEVIDKLLTLASEITEEQLSMPEVKLLINSTAHHFDLVIYEGFFPTMAAFAERFDCPLIQVYSMEPSASAYHQIGNPSNPVLNPDQMTGFTKNLDFVQRLISTLHSLFVGYFIAPRLGSVHNSLVQRHFGTNYPKVKEIVKKTSMMFVNTDLIFHPLRATYPNVVQFGGGSHFTPPKPLPKDLRIQLDNATNGFIYFSLGSNIKSEKLPESVKKTFLDTFSELPYTILWKFEDEDLKGKPDNVIISKWLPQIDVLRHPNIKLFITQCGLQSTEEAIYNHVPILGIPFIVDQKANANKIVDKGIGLSLDHKTIDKSKLKSSILRILKDPKYYERVQELAELARDQPMTGIERAIWWTEYVIRHKGAHHLKSPALDLPWYQYFLLDVIGFCVALAILSCYVLYRLCNTVWTLIKLIAPTLKKKLD